METRSRKRAEASSAAPSSSSSTPPRTTRSTSTKRSRLSSSSSSIQNTTTRSRSSPNPMDSHHATDSSGSRRDRRARNSDRDNSDKGKEKEHDVRVRDRDRDPTLGINLEIDGSGDYDDNDNDNDSEGGAGMFHENLTSASSALQGLLRKLGAGLDDLLPSSVMAGSASSSHQHGRLKKILSGLRADGEEGRQVEALSQLCDMLSIGTEDSLSTFSVDSFVPVLVGLLSHEGNPDIMLLAARALTHLCDVLPSSCTSVVSYGAVPLFCARLLTIEYMDLAEQSLQALKKISQEHPTPCLRAGALMAVLSYLDFFSTGVQRVALSTAANMCKKLPSDAADFVMEAVPLLTNLLQYHDSKVLEHASICLTRITEAFASSPDKLDDLCNHGLVAQAASLISTSSSGGGQASLSTSTYTGLIRLLSMCASGSSVGAKTLLLLGISGILKDILSGSGVSSNASVSPALSRPAEQIFEIVNLANELLPPLPQESMSLPVISNAFLRGPVVKKSPASSSGTQEDTNGSVHEISAREKILNDQPELLQQFEMDLLPVLMQIYGSSGNGPVRHKCLSVIRKVMYFSTAEMIQSLLSVTNISSFLAGVLGCKDPHILVPSLQIAEILMEKLPGTFSKMFVREGVVHAIDQLILTGNSTNITTQASSREKDNDSVSGSSFRPRRYRLRSGNSNPVGNSLEDSRNPVPVNVGLPPSSVETPTVNSSNRSSVSSAAKAFKDKYFPSDPGAVEVGVSDDLLHLKNLCTELNTGVDGRRTKAKGKVKASGFSLENGSANMEEYLIGVISDMLKELGKGDGVSTFEFIGSGVVEALLNYLSCGYFSKDRISETNLPKLRQLALTRFKSFVAVVLPSNSDNGVVAPMTILVQKLQNALSSLECFPVVPRPSRSTSESARLSSGLGTLSEPVKLRLCRAQGEKSLKDYSSNVVMIDPLASLAAIEEFLWPRVQHGESGQKSTVPAENSESGTIAGAGVSSSFTCTPSTARRHSTRSRSSVNIGDTPRKEISQDKSTSSSKVKGKAVLKPAQEEPRGTQTRNAAHRRAAINKDAQMKPPISDSTSEDEELDISPFGKALMIEDEDISDDDDEDHDDVLGGDSLPVCSPDKVHDVKLGEPAEESNVAPATSDSHTNAEGGSISKAGRARGSDSTDFRSGYSSSSRGSLSFAAAAMAGLGYANSRGFRGGRDRHGHLLFGSFNDPPKLIFTAGGRQLSRNLTIYQATHRPLDEDDEDRYGGSDFVSSDGSGLWGDIYSITYQRAENQTDRDPTKGSNSNTSKSAKSGSASKSSSEAKLHQISLLDSILQGELPCNLEKSNPTYNILALLRLLEGLNQLAPCLRAQMVYDCFAEGKMFDLDDLSLSSGARVPPEEFVSSKLTPKFARQIQDALTLCSGTIPSWCNQLTKACPFLFPFETRRQYFYSTAFGLSRALYRLQQQQAAEGLGSATERGMRVGRLQRQKVRVSRNRILDSAAKVMEMYSSQKAVLEVEYFGEVGTGLGPTLEFYTILSHDLQKIRLQMWRSSEKREMEVDGDENKIKSSEVSGSNLTGDGELVQAPLGLFPQPWPTNVDASDGNQFAKVVEYFRLLGRVMAKALQDGRLLDLPLSVAFYKLVVGQDLDLRDILFIDAELGKSLQELKALVCRKHYIESIGGSSTDANTNLHFHGTPIEDLCLDFTLPGYPEYILKPGDEIVDINNLEEYISSVVDATVKTGIMRQMEAFRAGFNQVFDISSLQIFSPQELDNLLCGRRELWEAETLAEHIKFDHGYTAKSPAIVNLLEIMGEFTPEQQRAFCQFVTGAPRLPPGGLSVLSPKLTIVRKLSSSAVNTSSNANGPSESADDDLPSVMTCANYLKLPPYSTKEIMYRKLLYAISEGQGSFDLS